MSEPTYRFIGAKQTFIMVQPSNLTLTSAYEIFLMIDQQITCSSTDVEVFWCLKLNSIFIEL